MQTTISTLCSPICKNIKYVCSIQYGRQHEALGSTRLVYSFQDLNPAVLPDDVATALSVITYIGVVVSTLSLLLMIATYLYSK